MKTAARMASGDRSARLQHSVIAAAAGFFAYMVSRGVAEGGDRQQ